MDPNSNTYNYNSSNSSNSSSISNVNQNQITQNENSNLLPNPEPRVVRRGSLISLNQSVLNNMMRTIGTGALSPNAQQQAKYFFDFQNSNSVSL